jgi:hypothetical protein
MMETLATTEAPPPEDAEHLPMGKRSASPGQEDEAEVSTPGAEAANKRPKTEAAQAANPNDNANTNATANTNGSANANGPNGEDWDTMYQRLSQFKEENGHVSVTLQSEEAPELGAWGK